MIKDNSAVPPSTTAPSFKAQHVSNQSISSNTDRSSSPLLVSPTSPPLVELSPSQVHSLSTTNPSSHQKTATKAKSRPSPKPGPKVTNHKKTTSTVNQGTRFPAHTNTGERQCTNCSEIDTPQWRGTLCNACALWKRSRGTDRPLPLLFPVRRRSPTPEDDDELSDGIDDEGEQQEYQNVHNYDQINQLAADRYNQARRGSILRESSPMSRNDIHHHGGRRKFWVDRQSRANSENPTTYQTPGMMQPGYQTQHHSNMNNNVVMRPRLGMGIIRGGSGGGRGHAHGRTMSYQPTTHNRSSSLSQTQPFPNLSIVPPNPQDQQFNSHGHSNPPQTGRIQGIHSTPVSPTHHINHQSMNPDQSNPIPYAHNLNQEADIKPSAASLATNLNNANLQNRIANLMSQVQLPENEKRKRRNSSPTSITTPMKRSYSSPPPNHHNNANHRRDESEEIRSPYLPYSLDKRGKSKLGNLISTVNPGLHSFSPEIIHPDQNRSSRPDEDDTLPEKRIMTKDDIDHHDLDVGLTKDEFLRGAEWLFDILQSTSKLLSRTSSVGQGHTDQACGPNDEGIEDDAQNSHDQVRIEAENSKPNPDQDQGQDGDQGGLDILGKVAEEEYNKVNLM